MEMTRREFFQSVLKITAAIAVGAYFIADKVSPKRFVRAVRQKRYPGSIKQLPNTFTQGKWRG
jgi:hypothetical protein